MGSQSHHLASQKLKGPAGAARRRARAGCGHQKRLLPARELALGARARLFVERSFEVTFHEAALGAGDGGAAHAHALGDGLVRHPSIGSKQDLRPLERAGGLLAAFEHALKLAAFVLAELDAVAYVHDDLRDRGRHGSDRRRG